MKDLGELRYFLGIEIVRTKEGIWLSQRQYALDMLSKYGMADCKPISMPLDQNLKLRADEGQVLEDVTMYRKIVGSLIYLTISRPDLSYTVGLESWLGESVYAASQEATFGCGETHIALCECYVGLCTLL